MRSGSPVLGISPCVRTWLNSTTATLTTLSERAASRLRTCGGVLAAPAYLLRLSLSPTEDDWQADGDISRKQHLLDALRRPFRLVRKYGRGNKSWDDVFAVSFIRARDLISNSNFMGRDRVRLVARAICDVGIGWIFTVREPGVTPGSLRYRFVGHHIPDWLVRGRVQLALARRARFQASA